MLKVLFVDDEKDSVIDAKNAIEEKFQGAACQICNFRDAKKKLRSFSPDIVVLDIFKGTPQQNDTSGLNIHKFIWNDWFCPIVIYSALPDDISEDIEKHPFVQLVQKGAGSEDIVVSNVENFHPHIEALTELQNHLRILINEEMKNLAPLVFSNLDNDDKRKEFFVRSAKRRIAAMMDEPLEKILCWEQYLLPPVGKSLRAGDIIKSNVGDKNDPSSYRVVLTPSCDLVSEGGRIPKVDSVLVARCTNVDEMLSDMNVTSNAKLENMKKKVRSLLTRGFGNSCLPLPELPGVLPHMVANLKVLDIIKLDKIGKRGKSGYTRVVSVDSPFREMIVWAYLQISGRPGLPDRDFDDWANRICEVLKQNNQGAEE